MFNDYSLYYIIQEWGVKQHHNAMVFSVEMSDDESPDDAKVYISIFVYLGCSGQCRAVIPQSFKVWSHSICDDFNLIGLVWTNQIIT